MSDQWPKVKLGDVLRRSEETVEPVADTEYREITVRLWGKGVVERSRAVGASLSGRRFVAHAGQFIASRIDARNGAMGLVPESLEGALVTNDFPLFNLNTERLQPEYLGWLSRTAGFVELCRRASEGTTNRVRLQEGRFYALEIPLPPLSEQRRVVARIEKLANQINEAQNYRQEAAEEAEALGKFRLSDFVAPGALTHPLRELCTQITDGEHATPLRIDERQVPLVTAKNVRDGYLDMSLTDFVSRETAEKCWKRCRPKDGDVLMVCVGATTGRVCRLVADPEVVIVRSVAMLRCDEEALDPRYLEYALESRETQSQIWDSVKQAAQPCLYLNRIGNLSIPVPPLPEQRQIVSELDELQATVDALKRLQAETADDINALLPSVLDKAFKGEL